MATRAVIAARADISMDARAQSAPAFDVRIEAEHLRAPDRAVERDPSHHLRICEVLRLAPYLPDAAVLVLPDRLEMLGELPLEAPAGLVGRQAALPGLVQ